MKTLNSRIRDFSNKHKLRKQSRIAASVLSVCVVLAVFVSLIMPAISVTDKETINSNEGIVTYANEGGISLGDYISSASVTPNEGQENELDEKQCKFRLEFFLPPEIAKDIDMDNRTLYYQLPDNVKVPENGIDWTPMTDPDFPSAFSARFSVSPDGLVTIIFTEEYIQAKCIDSNDFATRGVGGHWEFDSTVVRGKNETGDVDINFGTNESGPSSTVEFKEREVSVGKSGQLDSDSGEITWTIVINNPKGDDMTGAKIADDMFKDGYDINIVPADALEKSGDGYVVSASGAKVSEITITYKTKIPSDELYQSGNIANKVSYTPVGSSEPSSEDTANVPHEGGYSIEKSGTADYLNDELPANVIYWTIKINTKYNADLTGLVIQDDAFKDIDAGSISMPDGVEYQFDSTTGTITITKVPDGFTAPLEINYSTSGAEVGPGYNNLNKNKATLYPPSDDPDNPKLENEITSSEVNAEYWPFQTGKSVDSMDADGNITWSITVTIKTEKGTLEGMYVIDEMFKGLNPSDISVKEDKWDGKDIGFTLEGNKLTFTEDLPYNGGDRTVRITFTTKVPADQIVDGSYTVTNVEGLYNQNGDKQGEDSATAEYKKRRDVTKTKGNVTENQSDTYREIPWTVTIGWDESIAGQELSDVLTVDIETEKVLHYMTEAQSQNFDITYKTITPEGWEQWITLDPSNYTISFTETDGKITGYTIIFKDNSLTQTITDLKVSYSSTVDLENVPPGTELNFVNTAEFDGKPSEEKYYYKKLDTDNPPYNKYDAAAAQSDGSLNNTTTTGLAGLTTDADGNYIFSWLIALNEDHTLDDKSFSEIRLTDTLPEGFELIEDEVYLFYPQWDGSISWNNSDGTFSKVDSLDSSYDNRFVIETSGNTQTVVFAMNDYWGFRGSTVYIWYKAKITPDALSALLKKSDDKVINTVQGMVGDVEFAPVEQQVTIEEGEITKTITNDDNTPDRTLKYSIDVNPSGKQLAADGEMIHLEDTFTILGPDQGVVDILLSDIKVVKINDDGSEEVLDRSQFKYKLDNEPDYHESPCGVSLIYEGSNGEGPYYRTKVWKIDNIGGEVIVELECEQGATIVYTFVGADANDLPIWGGNGNETNQNVTDEDGDGRITLTYEPTSDSKSVLFALNGGEAEPTSVTATSMSADYAAMLYMDVPDKMHLRIDYIYYAVPNKDISSVDVMNSVGIVTEGKAVTSSSGTTLELSESSSGGTTTGNKAVIQKVDADNYNLLLKADFSVSRYNSETGKWEYAVVENNQVTGWSEEPNDDVITTSDDSGAAAPYSLDLGDQTIYTLYRITEVRQPNGYIMPINNVWYFAYSELIKDKLPSDLEVDYDDIVVLPPSVNRLDVPNKRSNDITVVKEWADGEENHKTDSVFVQLYKSTEYVENGFPDVLEEVGEPVELNDGNGWTHTWENLDDDDWYYYIKEIGYENTDYKPVYSDNGINRGTITVTNNLKAELTVVKEWKDAEDKDYTPPEGTSIKFKLWQSTTAPDQLTDGELPTEKTAVEVDGEDEFVLDSDNEWSKKFKDLPEKDGGGNKYYYYIEETECPEGYSTEIVSDSGNENFGIVTITNTLNVKAPEEVEMPETGGIGRIGYYAVGAVSFVMLIAVLVKRKLNLLYK